MNHFSSGVLSPIYLKEKKGTSMRTEVPFFK